MSTLLALWQTSLRRRVPGTTALAVLAALLSVPGTLRAVDRFDVFLGYDACIREMSWFPVVCEVENRGPVFKGFIEITGGSFNNRTTRRVPLELPTGTTKRLTVPVFFESGHSMGWTLRVRDERGRLRSEQPNVPTRRIIKPEGVLVGALSRNAAWTPEFHPLKVRQRDLEPAAARLLTPVFPDNPLVLGGMDALYLNSERAVDLRPAQQSAITQWARGGGHLIVAVESISDVNSVPWLREMVQARLTGMRTVRAHPELQDWLRSKVNYGSAASAGAVQPEGWLSPAELGTATLTHPFADVRDDPAFEAADLQVAVGEFEGATVLVSCEGTPLIVQRRMALGRVTVLLFSPEREPFRSWKNLPVLWSRLAEVPPQWHVSTDQPGYGGWSVDGIFGAMIDSRQVRKLPVQWLLLLLAAYLVVIGPLDRWWLKKINRPMLTWITFPVYVVLFSGLIYVIGYKLRAGEREWNEFHIVDVLPAGSGALADLRGRTYGSLYSPVNETYRLRAPQGLAAFRGEAASSWSGNVGSENITVIQENNTFVADAFVPVWTSQLFVNDWWEQRAAPVRLQISPARGGGATLLSCKLVNTTDQPLQTLRLVAMNRLFELGDLAPGESRTVQLRWEQGRALDEWVTSTGGNYFNVVQSRRRAFGATEGGRLDDQPGGTLVASFISKVGQQISHNRFLSPTAMDLSRVAEGNAILFAYAPGQAAAPTLRDFTAVRSGANTIWRVVVPLNDSL